MSAAEQVTIVRLKEVEATVAGGDGHTIAYLTLISHAGDAMNVLIDSRQMACHLSALMLDVADSLP